MRAALFELSITCSKWLTERASRSRRTTTRTSPALDLAHKLGQHRPSARGAGAVLLMDDLAAGGAQLVDLRVGRLLLGGDAGVADEAAGGSERGRGWRHGSNWGWFSGLLVHCSTAVSNRPVADVFYRPILRARKARNQPSRALPPLRPIRAPAGFSSRIPRDPAAGAGCP